MILSIVLQVLLGIGFMMFGYQKFVSDDMKKGFEYFGYSNGFRLFTGMFEIMSALVVWAGIWFKPLAVIGGLMIVATMIGAIATHMKMKDEPKQMRMPIILLMIATVVVILNVPVVI